MAKAYANSAVILVCFSIERLGIADFRGFEIVRTDIATGERTVLNNHMGFPGWEQGFDDPQWLGRPSTEWPFQWPMVIDRQAEPGKIYTYTATPMTGAPGALVPRTDLATTTNQVSLQSVFAGGQITYIVNSSRQKVPDQLTCRQFPKGQNGAPDPAAVAQAMGTPGNAFRENVAREMIELDLKWVNRRAGHTFWKLYELTDVQFVTAICDPANAPFHTVMLGNAGTNDAENGPTRQRLKAAGVEVIDRMLPQEHLPHNKFAVWCDESGVPQEVLDDSRNVTRTAYVGQYNCLSETRNRQIAGYYFAAWQRYKQDANLQGSDLRTANAAGNPPVDLGDGVTVTVWFDPTSAEPLEVNSEGQVVYGPNFVMPPDLVQANNLVTATRDWVSFTEFMAGPRSVFNTILDEHNKRPDLAVHGVVNSPAALPRDNTPAKPAAPHTTDPAIADIEAKAPGADPPFFIVANQFTPAAGPWWQELLEVGFAVLHMKSVTGDPRSKARCYVIKGSSNLGPHAAANNDDTLVITQGCPELSQAVMVSQMDNVLWFYERDMRFLNKDTSVPTLDTTDAWQKPFQPGGVFYASLDYLTAEDNQVKP